MGGYRRYSAIVLEEGGGVRLDLKAAEVLKIFRELADLYKVHARDGIPLGETKLIRADSVLAQMAKVPRDQIRTYLTANQSVGEELLTTLLNWAIDLQNPTTLLSRVVSLEAAAVKGLSAAVGLESLRRAVKIWNDNADSNNEEFWQRTLTEHSFVLEQVFSWPTTIVKGKAYVGGKTVLNTGGNIVDFLVKNYMTSNAALVEIKTPSTPLLGRRYRDGVYIPSEELSGSVMQIANYRYSLEREFYSLRHGLTGALETFEPKRVVIIGNTKELADDEARLRSFELFRGQSGSVTVITYDELFAKTRRLTEVLEGSTAGSQEEVDV